MDPVGKKYFIDYSRQSVFNNQADLAATLKKLGHNELIESNEVNPLTVRLFSCRDGLDKISNVSANLQIRAFPNQLSTSGFYTGPPVQGELYGSQAVSGATEFTQSWPTIASNWANNPLLQEQYENFRVEEMQNGGIRIIDTECNVPTFDLHHGIYMFFANFESILDRIRLELNSVYFDGQKKLNGTKGNKYWDYYTEKNNNCIKQLDSKGFSKLTSVLTGCRSQQLTTDTKKYRNRLIHDGYLEIEIDKQRGKVFIPDDPMKLSPTFKTELLPFVTKAFDELQNLLKTIYAQIIEDLNSKPSLPLAYP